jgi:ppGpp synthetase/RelA/SpoT-type nucleotidyltranferase
MPERTIQDRLRQEYFELLPEITLVAEELRARIQFYTLDIAQDLELHEHLIVKSRIKERESAIAALERRAVAADMTLPSVSDDRRRPDRLGTFNPDTPDAYSLTNLRDLAGVRVLAFPPRRLQEINDKLQTHFPEWISDPFRDVGEQLAFKSYGLCPQASSQVRGEYQIVSMLTGLFWEVEHAAIYKQSPHLKNVVRALDMKPRQDQVYEALQAFEAEFESLIQVDKLPIRTRSDIP